MARRLSIRSCMVPCRSGRVFGFLIMPPIARRDSMVTVTPGDDLQIITGPGHYELVDDRSAFTMQVRDIIEESGQIIGVSGPVISGHPRYRNQVATLLVRVDGADWSRDNRSGANFLVGSGAARRVPSISFRHPDGVKVEGYPVIVRYGSIDSRGVGEEAINSAWKRAG